MEHARQSGNVSRTCRELGISRNPHVHALVSRGGWTRDDRFVPTPYVDPLAAQRLFRHEVFAFLLREELISPARVELLSSWRHSGFSVHDSVYLPPGDHRVVEALIRYIMRPPVSLIPRPADSRASRLASSRS